MAQRIEAARIAMPGVQPPAFNPGAADGVAPEQAVHANVDEQDSRQKGGQDARPNIERVNEQDEDPAVAEARKALGMMGRQLSFRMDHDTGELIVQIKDPTTGKVERQIPQDQVLKLHEKMLNKEVEQMVGLLFHEAA